MIKKLLFVATLILGSLFITANTDAQQGYWGNGRVVGYYPVVTWYPQGIYYSPNVYVYPNRRYVRVGGTFGYSGVTAVYTFNMYTGRYERIR